MSRGQGRVYPDPKHGNWMLDYTLGGKRVRVSSGTTVKRDALDMLAQRMGDTKVGKIIGRPEKVFLAEYKEERAEDGSVTKKLVGGLRYLHETQYDLDGLRAKDRVVQLWNHIEKFFPAPTPVTAVTEIRLDEYAKARLAEGAARQTVNNELSALRRGFSLATKKKLLAVAPTFDIPKVDNARQGFFSDGDFAALLLELPAFMRPVIEFLRFTGWRIEEALHLTWDMVDWEGSVMRLTAALAKAKTPRLFPFGAALGLKTLLNTQWKARQGEYVFHQNGARITYNSAWYWWKQARKRAALPAAKIHDLRRTTARDMRRSGLSEGVIMKLCGWKTRSMFDRYNIIDEADLAQSVARHFNGSAMAVKPASPQGAAA